MAWVVYGGWHALLYCTCDAETSVRRLCVHFHDLNMYLRSVQVRLFTYYFQTPKCTMEYKRLHEAKTLVNLHQVGSVTSIPNWDKKGSTFVTPDHIRLTADKQSSQGALWNAVVRYIPPVPYTICAIYQSVPLSQTFSFNLSLLSPFTSKTGTCKYGDGLAIWYVKDHSELGPVFGSKDFFHGLAQSSTSVHFGDDALRS